MVRREKLKPAGLALALCVPMAVLWSSCAGAVVAATDAMPRPPVERLTDCGPPADLRAPTRHPRWTSEPVVEQPVDGDPKTCAGGGLAGSSVTPVVAPREGFLSFLSGGGLLADGGGGGGGGGSGGGGSSGGHAAPAPVGGTSVAILASLTILGLIYACRTRRR